LWIIARPELLHRQHSPQGASRGDDGQRHLSWRISDLQYCSNDKNKDVNENDPPAIGVSLKDLQPAQSARLSELLDESLDMTAEERGAWLEELEQRAPAWAAFLRKMFAAQGGSAQKLLETHGEFARGLAAMGGEDPVLIGKQFGPYRVLSLLGHGGMGSVWLAERTDGLFTRQVALKLVHPALMSRVINERSIREREILASLNHPNIARLIDAGFADDGQPYLALEYVAGTPLTAYCDHHRLSIRERLELFQQVLNAVQYAHAHLVIHRDLKPSNIMVTEAGQVYLLDFGIAKLLTEGEAKETELTRLGGRALTPDYAAPEQIAGAPITTAADVYALGVMLYELLIGERPYRLKRDTRGALEEAILQADPIAPSRAATTDAAAGARSTTTKKLSKSLKSDLDTIVIKALKKSPSERYATANAFDEDIGRFLRGDVVLAQRDSFAYRAMKFARRYRIAIAVASVLILTLAAGLAATSYEAEVASVQRDAALQAQLRSLTQTAAARLRDSDVSGGLSIVLEILPHGGSKHPLTPEALSVFQQARAADSQIMTMTGHTDRVRSVAFSTDSQRVVTASYDKTARIWDAATGREVTRLRGHADRVMSAAFSLDGTRVVTASVDKTAKIWDAATGREIMSLGGHSDRVTTAAFSPDGRRVVTSSYDKTARIWDVASGRQILSLDGHTDLLGSAAFSADGRVIVTASYDKTARLWEASTGKQLMVFKGHTDRLNSAALSPDGGRVVTASADKSARVWDVASGRQLALLIGHTDRLTFAAFSPDGLHIVTAAYDNTARIWDAATGQETARLKGHTDFVEGAVFSPDGRRVVTGSDDRTARIWDAVPRGQILLLRGHSESLGIPAFSADGLRIATCSTDKTARVWDALTGQEIALMTGHTGSVDTVAFSPDGRHIMTSSFDKTARIWDAATGRQLMMLTGHTDVVASAAFSPDGLRVVTTSFDKTARIWDAANGQMLRVLSGHADFVETGAFSPDGGRIVTASNDRTARIWDADSGKQLLVLSGHTDQVVSAAFSPDGRHIVTASADKTARVWDAATGLELMVLSGHTDALETASFSPDGLRIVTASADRTARVWDAETGLELLLLSGHTDLVEAAIFSPDGKRLLTTSDDMTARIWAATTYPLDSQIGWAASAQFDSLPSAERFQLGLPPPTHVRRWSDDRTKCDESAAAPYDPDRRAPGFMLEQVVSDIALGDCAPQNNRGNDVARLAYQRGRALMANGDFPAARRDLEAALTQGYRSARVDLGMLLVQASAGMLDAPRAIALYEQAWKSGVPMAGFVLGNLYERGMSVPADPTLAWVWYQKAADAGEPNALARFAERASETANAQENAAKRTAQWLESFKYYAAAAEHARSEDWPDSAWRNWRYHRASLARLLARQGMMPEVAQAYDDVRQQNTPPATLRDRLTSLVGNN
jgi:WD40 repeat protein/tRNA A-37 threonylcarbamoyl transferase component Bud32